MKYIYELITPIGAIQNKMNYFRQFSRISSNIEAERVTLRLSDRWVNTLVPECDFHE
jgi:hypothetical protein